MKTIKEAEAALKAQEENSSRLENEAQESRKEERRIEEFLNALAYGVKPGSIVQHDGGEYLVTHTGSYYRHSPPALYGRKRLKSGEWHASTHYIGHRWTLATTATP